MESYNDLVYAIAKRAMELADMKMDALRETAGYGCETPHEARQMNRHRSRGQVIEVILTEEFVEEFDRQFTD